MENLKEAIRATQELQFDVNLTPKKELKTKKDFSDALDIFEKSLDKFILDREGIDEDDDFNHDIVSRNNERINVISSLITDIKLELRFIENLS
jgi:hypothetical protein